MKKSVILRGVLGFPLGITIGYCITIATSLIWAGGYYSPCVPELIAIMGSEIRAVLLQALLFGLLGTGFGMASAIWEIERWSLVRQTAVYFLTASVIMLPIAYLTRWMEHTVAGFLGYFGIFALIFAIVWVAQFLRCKRSVKKLNDGLSKSKET